MIRFVLIILILGSRIKHEGIPFVVCGIIHCVFDSDGPKHFIGLSHTPIDSNFSLWGDLSQLLIDIREIVMDNRLVMLFIECEKVTIGTLRGFSWANSAFVEYNLDFSKIRASWPGFEDTLSNVHQKVHSATNDEIYVVGMVTFLIDILSILDF